MRKFKIKTLISYCTIGLLLSMNSLFADHFPFAPPKNFTLNPKYIALHHPVTTSQVLAQLYFDQGLTFMYAFNHDAAYWSFLRASQVDPDMAMAYWGIAIALGTNINIDITPTRAHVAYDSIQRALQLSSTVTESEKDYIQALAKRYTNQPQANLPQLAQDYNQAMRKLVQKYPDDLDAAVLFAESILDLSPWNQWSHEGKPLPGTLEAVNILESVLKRSPNHLGANHYYIHVIEASPYPERALMSAERLRKLLPSSGHLLHMPSHIYFLVGDYQQAARSNEEAVARDREYIREYGLEGIYPVHYLSHNLFLLSRAYTMLGRFSDANQAANEVFSFYLPHFKQMPELEFYLSAPLSVSLFFHKWQNLLDLSKPTEDLKVTTGLWHFGRAMAFASLGNITQAEKERRLFLQSKETLLVEATFGNNKADKIFTLATYLLEGKLAEVKGNVSRAIEFLQRAVAEQDSLRYNEPPDWFFPIRESLGGTLLRANYPQDAEQIFREDLRKHPRNGRSLFGLRESLRAQSRFQDAYWVNQEYQEAWMYSDTSLNVRDL